MKEYTKKQKIFSMYYKEAELIFGAHYIKPPVEYFKKTLNVDLIVNIELINSTDSDFFYEITYLEKVKSFQHYKNNLIYSFKEEVKIQENNEWKEYVLYERDCKSYMRLKDEFYEKFKEI